MSTHSNSVDRNRGTRTSSRLDVVERRTTLELARIYVSSSASAAALEALDRLPRNGWDEEALLLRAEALIGLGRFAEAEGLLGAPLLPELRSVKANTPAGATSGRVGHLQLVGRRATPLSRVERYGLWRFLLLLRILHRTGRSQQVLGLGRAFFGRPGAPVSTYVARIAAVMAQAMLSQNRPAEARDLYEQVLDLYRVLQSKEGVADTLLGIANSQLLDCHWDEADALYQECRFRYEDLGQTDKALAATINLGVLRIKRGEFTSGRTLLGQALKRAAQVGDRRRTATIHLGLAMAETRCGSHDLAAGHLLSAVREARRTNNRRTQALFLEFLGELRVLSGNPERGRRTLELGLRIAKSLAAHGDIVFEIQRRLAEIAVGRGRVSEARAYADSCVEGSRRYGDSYEGAVAERVRAEADELDGDLISALERANLAAGVLDRLGETYERARLELLRLHLLHALGRISSQTVQARSQVVTRSFERTPHSPVILDARRLLGALQDQPPAPPGPQRSSEKSSETPFTDDDERMFLAVGLATKDPTLRQALALARQVAELPVPVLILGEAGTGREKLARLIHGWSRRAGIYMPFHCADLPPNYLEAELFGDEATSTGGVISASHQGTLFLDEVTELPTALQRRLQLWMRVREGLGSGLDLHPESMRPDWGSEQGALSIPEWEGLDVRLLAAATIGTAARPTRSGLQEELYRQLGRVVIEIPPLRKRPDDVVLLAKLFLDQARDRYGEDLPDFPPALIREFRGHPWLGNLRDLRRAVDFRVAALRGTVA